MAHQAPGQATLDSKTLQFGPVFEDGKGAFMLMNCEVKQLLEERKSKGEKSNADGDSHLPEKLEQTLEYVTRFSQFGTQEAAESVRELLQGHPLHPFEQAQLGNLCPEDPEEAKSIIPSLAAEGKIDDADLRDVLHEMQAHRNIKH
eukprot:m.12210 g.12210  ORF g.12210 m.12210 type:complete len:146 (+) comp4612_c0_seq1:107-544(+)